MRTAKQWKANDERVSTLSISVDRTETDKIAKEAPNEYIVPFLLMSLAVKLTFVHRRKLRDIARIRVAENSKDVQTIYCTF